MISMGKNRLGSPIIKVRAVGCAERSEAHRSREKNSLDRCSSCLGTSYAWRILRVCEEARGQVPVGRMVMLFSLL